MIKYATENMNALSSILNRMFLSKTCAPVT